MLLALLVMRTVPELRHPIEGWERTKRSYTSKTKLLNPNESIKMFRCIEYLETLVLRTKPKLYPPISMATAGLVLASPLIEGFSTLAWPGGYLYLLMVSFWFVLALFSVTTYVLTSNHLIRYRCMGILRQVYPTSEMVKLEKGHRFSIQASPFLPKNWNTLTIKFEDGSKMTVEGRFIRNEKTFHLLKRELRSILKQNMLRKKRSRIKRQREGKSTRS